MPDRKTMGLAFGLQTLCFPRKFRWLFTIKGISADEGSAESLPPMKGARPSINFKEIDSEHLSETIYFPGKPDWKPITLTLYDLKKNKNPVFEWLKKFYDPCSDSTTINYSTSLTGDDNGFKRDATLELYDGCGHVIETWTFENVWPQSIEFGDLDMASSDVVTVDVTLRYDRATRDCSGGGGGGSSGSGSDSPNSFDSSSGGAGEDGSTNSFGQPTGVDPNGAI
jgi:hypothetical protein